MIYKSASVDLPGGTWVLVQLHDVANRDDAPHTELTTRFLYKVEGQAQTWGYSVVIPDLVSYAECMQLFNAEVARYARFSPVGATYETTDKD